MKFNHKLYIIWIILLLFIQIIFLYAVENISAGTVYMITDSSPGTSVKHGLNKIRNVLKDKNINSKNVDKLESVKGNSTIVAGLSKGSGLAATILKSLKITPPGEKEELLIQHIKWEGKKVLLVSGADDRGLMYALLDVADRIGWSEDKKNPFEKVQNIKEKPYVSERALSKYTMHRGNVESYFYNEKYWARYLDMLAENRFNTFVFILGYSPATHFAPAYPFFFDVKGYPDIKVDGLSKEEQLKNLNALNKLIKMCHDRGLDFTLGIWDHIGRKNKSGYNRPKGVTKNNLVPYTKAAISKLLRLVPELDAIQFRMHWESGLPRDEQVLLEFWGTVFRMIKDSGKNKRVDLRAKGLPDSVIEKAREVGVNFRITTKYWAEQMGLPFHPAHINRRNQHDRRHGYADLLKYPLKYKMHWRMWNAGSNKVLLWGDPDYARRFAKSTHLYDGDGFEVNEIGATKMAFVPKEKPFDLLKKTYQYYDWEFERYWHFFKAFGRMGYNPETSSEVWQKEYEKRFGIEAAPDIEKGVKLASRILPRIIGYAMNNFSTDNGFPEKDRYGDLEKYIKIRPSDIQTFLGIYEAAKYIIEGKESAKIWPQETSKWFTKTSTEILELVNQAEQKIGSHRNKEFNSTMIDLKILAYLSLYHSQRIHAGINYALFKRINDMHSLNKAMEHEKKAIDTYEKIIQSAGDAYSETLWMGRLKGHWKDELDQLKKDYIKLEKKREKFEPKIKNAKPVIAHVPVRTIRQNEDIVISATINSKYPLTSVQVGYSKGEQNYEYLEMKKTGEYIYQAKIPATKFKEKVHYFIEIMNKEGFLATYPGKARSKPIVVIVKNDFKPPLFIHKPITSAFPLKPLKITVEVKDASGIKWVRVLYRNVTQFQDYKILEMRPGGKKGQYEAVIPGKEIVPEWDFMYLFEVMDKQGNGKIYPDMEKETPYIVVKLKR